MLFYYRSCVNANDVVALERLGNGGKRLAVEVGLVIGRHDDRPVDNQEIGIGGGQTFAVLVHDRVIHGQRQQTVRLALGCAQRAQLGLQRSKVGVLLIVGSCRRDVEERVVRREAHNGVYVSVGVVANEVAVVEPHHTVGTEHPLQMLLNVVLRHGLVTVRREQTLACRHDGALAVALYRASLKHKLVLVHIHPLVGAKLKELSVEGVVLVGSKLVAPSVEAEVDEMAFANPVLRQERYESVVACPCVVVVASIDPHTAHLLVVKALCQQLAHLVGLSGGNDERLIVGHSFRDLHERVCYVFEIRLPVGVGVRPCQLHPRLVVPLGWKIITVVCHCSGFVLLRLQN